MFRYFAFVWDADSRSQRDTVEGFCRRVKATTCDWREIFDVPGMRVLTGGAGGNSGKTYRLHSDCGVVVGTLFKKNDTLRSQSLHRETMLGERETFNLRSTNGRALIESYWGRYIAFLHDAATFTTSVLRDPTGNLPCYFARYKGITALFSCMEDCARVEEFSLQVDWDYVRNRVAWGPTILPGIGICNSYELHRGECLTIKGATISRRLYWSPETIAKSNVIEDEGIAKEQLLSAMKTCGHAWASRHESILVRLSGGLDSSAALSCLQDAPNRPRIACITYYIPRAHADERPWARLAAERAACDHVIRPRNFDLDLRVLLSAHRCAFPPDYLPWAELAPFEREIAAQRNATAVINGHGGDSLFGGSARRLIAHDYVYRRGFRLPLFKIAAGAALQSNVSVWNILAGIVQSYVSGSNFTSLRRTVAPNRRMVASELTSIRDRALPSHPWFAESGKVPSSLFNHVSSLIQSPQFYDPLRKADDSGLEPLELLHSQPIVETCLRIPLYVHSARGRSRGLVRQALKDDVPAPILNRQWKDRAPGSVESLFRYNRDFIQEILLDGILISKAYLDRKKVEGCLSGLRAKQTVFAHEVLDHLFVEAWLRSWKTAKGTFY
jgi:asparagine synthase (glutamine-hydrolysing)